ncbi:pentapeptide repeat-containing protein [Aliterella atlantica]|uniref:Pentapeptide repeat-containing protein n=1 Tax=Aliterella atlantica CENA595 TaxID=1618023 RepID=A0A0D8ZSB4_9CYAN|nr:pentapeptide repeat-containing protein [Aliterella atlantica]KJH71389.1 pentapeptide repeat-containing protein [Aliterella atlantica CENA595]
MQLTQNNYQIGKQFLLQAPQERLLTLKQVGLGRYADFLTKMPLTEANVACVMRFFNNPSRAKFPNLQAVELPDLVLDGVNFIRGNLSDANLSGSSLIDADLIFANFTGANLSNANLRGATLNETIWQGAIVENCNFGTGIGITNQQRQELISRGAVFMG